MMPATAAPEPRSESISPVAQIGGTVYALAADGDLLAVGLSDRIVLYDLSSLANPHRTAQYRFGWNDLPITAIALRPPYVYMANATGGFATVQILSDGTMEWRGVVALSGGARDMALEGAYAYIATDDGGLVVVDVSSPVDPRVVGSYVTGQPATAVAVGDGYAYVAAGSDGVVALDVHDPAHPRYRFCLWPAISGDHSQVLDVYLADNTLYAAPDNTPQLSVFTADVSDPEHPVLGATYSLPPWILAQAQQVVADATHVYVRATVWYRMGGGGTYGSVIYAFPVGQPSGTENQPRWSSLAPLHDLTLVSGQVCSVGGDTGLHLIDTLGMASITEELPPGIVQQVSGCGVALVAQKHAVDWLDLHDLVAPAPLGRSFPFATVREEIVAAGAGPTTTVLLLSDWTPAENWQILRPIDHSDPLAPSVGADLMLEDPVYHGLCVDRSVVYLWGSCSYLDLRSLYSLAPLARYQFDSDPASRVIHDVAIQDGVAYCLVQPVGWDSTHLSLVDVRSPAAPAPIVSTSRPGAAEHIAVDGNLVCATETEGTSYRLRVWDLSNFYQPRDIGELSLAARAQCLAMAHGYAYIGLGNQMVAVSLADPSHPLVTASWTCPEPATALQACGRYVTCALGQSGVVILRHNVGLPLYLPLVSDP
jgi:hypothetical protein